MSNLESIFVKEFRDSTKEKDYKDIFNVPLPAESKSWSVSGTEIYGVKGIELEYYSELNGSLVMRLPKNMVAKRRVIDKVTRSFKRNEDGSYEYEDYKVPSGSIVVVSEKKINLPYKLYLSNQEGYGYIDFVVDEAKGMQYMYVLPKSVLYKINQTALVISVKGMKNFSGMGYATWRMGKIFIHVIPYNPNSQYIGSKVLKTGYTLNYDDEIKAVVSYWEEVGFIPKLVLCTLQDTTNLAMSNTVVGYDESEYQPVESLPLSDKEIYGESNQ